MREVVGLLGECVGEGSPTAADAATAAVGVVAAGAGEEASGEVVDTL